MRLGIAPLAAHPIFPCKFSQAAISRLTARSTSSSLVCQPTLSRTVPRPTSGRRPIAASVAGSSVRPAAREDVPACNRLHFKVHGFERERDLLDAVEQGTARVAERGGRLTGYATAIGFFGHAVGESNDDLKALIAAAPEFAGPGFHLPMRNGELFRWCLDRGLKVVQPMTLMSLGLYSKPSGAFLPSILY